MTERVYTRPLEDKLGIGPGMRVAIVDVPDESLREMLRTRTDDITEGRPRPATDLVFLAANSVAQLAVLPALRARLKPAGGIWVVSRKGKTATLRDVEVMAAARAAGLIDNKVVSFSETHTSIRLVIPRDLR